jgi:hypothetical protein
MTKKTRLEIVAEVVHRLAAGQPPPKTPRTTNAPRSTSFADLVIHCKCACIPPLD